MRSLFVPITALVFLIGVAGLARPASADISPALASAMANTMKQSSYHITMSSPDMGGDSSGDMQPPTKMHMIMPSLKAEEILIGDTMYMKMNGKWTKSTGMAGIMDQSNALKKFQSERSSYTSTDLGMKTVAGATYHAYGLDGGKTKTHQVIYIDSHDRIARFEMGKMTMTFSNFGENVSIDPPQM
jgi:hypothetical protein